MNTKPPGRIDAIRSKIRTLLDAGKKDLILKLLVEFGIERVSQLPAEKYTEFMDKLNAIK